MAGESPLKWEFDSDRLILRIDISVAGEVGAVTPVVERIMTVVSEVGCAAGQEFEIELALQEALANAVVHGCGKDPAKRAQVSVACDEKRGILVVVRDPGSGFDVDQIPSPVVGERLFASHGRGIFLINLLMDEVRFERGGAEIWMRKSTTP
jgi:serine/threonine-protein kinase RsbW